MTLRPDQLLKTVAVGPSLTIALSEGADPRVVAGALAARAQGLAEIVLVGPRDAVSTALDAAGGAGTPGISVHDPADSPLTEHFAQVFFALRSRRGVTEEQAAQAVRDPLVYAALMVREGHAAGTVGGAVATTSDVVRAAIQMIGKAPGAALVSSFFLMYPPDTAAEGARAMLYADSGLVIDPSADELASIAGTSAESFRALMRGDPKVAMLSFSTRGSARHEAVSKVTEATETLRRAQPDLAVDGDLQFDAAFVPAVAARKAPESPVAGQANVMIFPNLDAGNISYKITQRVAGYDAIGPVLQGLDKPANDLSRGCSAQDVTQMIAVTVLQAQASRPFPQTEGA
ncbi:MAG: phosphate acetyltransferase [Pseudomonadota bacterium]